MGVDWDKGVMGKMEVSASKTGTVITRVSGPLSSWSSAFSLMPHNNLKSRLHDHHFTDEETKGQVRMYSVPRVI